VVTCLYGLVDWWLVVAVGSLPYTKNIYKYYLRNIIHYGEGSRNDHQPPIHQPRVSCIFRSNYARAPRHFLTHADPNTSATKSADSNKLRGSENLRDKTYPRQCLPVKIPVESAIHHGTPFIHQYIYHLFYELTKNQ
jgi:hypothetical protein